MAPSQLLSAPSQTSGPGVDNDSHAGAPSTHTSLPAEHSPRNPVVHEASRSTGLLSTRYGVLRAGLEARVPLAEWLELSAQGALRIAPDGGTDLGFDVAGGPELLLGELALVRAWARYAQQTGPEFEDRQLDLELALGVRL